MRGMKESQNLLVCVCNVIHFIRYMTLVSLVFHQFNWFKSLDLPIIDHSPVLILHVVCYDVTFCYLHVCLRLNDIKSH